jgi:hypothetical protein
MNFFMYVFIYLWLYGSLLNLGRFFHFVIIYTVGRTSWSRDQWFGRPLPTHRTTQHRLKSTQTSMPRLGIYPTIPVFERAKTVHALDRAATVIDCCGLYGIQTFLQVTRCYKNVIKFVYFYLSGIGRRQFWKSANFSWNSVVGICRENIFGYDW